MAVQDKCGGAVLPGGNGVSLNTSLNFVNGTQVKEQFSCGNDFSPKVRKPYTITKQRERWTEEEHKKFLEALKLYGRAWRRIEEHVGSKTAVQIRSHAQKFFSKVVRESNGPAEPIEIPPPRPKRKPMHPYPRKLVHPINKESSASEHQHRSLSPKLSISDNENQSPTSVLSVVCSDAVGSTDSNTPNGSLSPASCASGSHSPGDDGSRSASDEPSPKVPKLDLFPKEDVSEDGLIEETSTRSLKLFGRTVLVTGSQGNEQIGRPKSCQAAFNSMADEECKSPLYGGLPFPLGPFQKQETVKVILDSSGETQQKETQKEVSWTGSNSGSINCEKVERNTETESCNNENGDNPIFELKLIERSASSNNCMKGFVPYKKRAAERDNIRLCL